MSTAQPLRPGSLPQVDPDISHILVESVLDYAIFMLDPKGNVTSWNLGAERIKGYTAKEAIGLHLSKFYPSDAIARGWPDHALEVARKRGRFEDEGWRIRKDGTRFWANVTITAIHDREGSLRGFAKVTRDMTERRHAIALEASQHKVDEFIAMLGHELRNPLGVVKNTAVLVREHGESQLLKSAGEMLSRQVQHLSRLVDDLLDVSRIRSGKIVLREQNLNLADVVKQSIESAMPLMQERRHRMDVSFEVDFVPVIGDPVRLGQMIVNVLNNAAKYTPDGGVIAVSLSVERRCAVLRVIDNGMGIAHDLLNEIFAPFSQGHRTIERSDGGLGVGLTLARRIAELHGGSIVANSEGPNTGSEFVIRLPLNEEAGRPTASAAAAGKPSTGMKPVRVLVVDDNRDSADSLALLLGLEGYQAEAVYDGHQALQSYARQPWDVVVLDIGLPIQDGYAVAAQLREMDPQSRCTLVALTGYGQQKDKERAQGCGFQHHLLKPVDFGALREILVEVRKKVE